MKKIKLVFNKPHDIGGDILSLEEEQIFKNYDYYKIVDGVLFIYADGKEIRLSVDGVDKIKIYNNVKE